MIILVLQMRKGAQEVSNLPTVVDVELEFR